MTTKTINVTTTRYDGDVAFPEAEHFDDYVTGQLAERYPDAVIDVSFGQRAEVRAYLTGTADDDTVSADLTDEVKHGMWDDFCAHGYKDYSA